MTVLDRSWKNCLRMWKWISENLPDGFSAASGAVKEFVIDTLKRTWLKKNRFTNKMSNDCFFCAYDEKYGDDCEHCPAKLVETHFHCGDWSYHYYFNPIEFYNRLIKYDKIREATA